MEITKKNNQETCEMLEKIADNKLVKFAFMCGVILGIKIIIMQLIVVIKKLNNINDELVFIDELDFDELDFEEMDLDEL